MAKAWLILIIAAVLVSFAVFLSALLRANGRTEDLYTKRLDGDTAFRHGRAAA